MRGWDTLAQARQRRAAAAGSGRTVRKAWSLCDGDIKASGRKVRPAKKEIMGAVPRCICIQWRSGASAAVAHPKARYQLSRVCSEPCTDKET